MKAWKLIISILTLAGTVLAQHATTPTSPEPEVKRPTLPRSVNVVERTPKEINYRHRGGATTVGFKGTAMMPSARREAKVENQQGYIEIQVEFASLLSASRFGP